MLIVGTRLSLSTGVQHHIKTHIYHALSMLWQGFDPILLTNCLVADDSYVKHISSSTGTSVVLNGRGAGGAYERYAEDFLLPSAKQHALQHSNESEDSCRGLMAHCCCCSPEPLHLFVSGGDAKGNEEAVK